MKVYAVFGADGIATGAFFDEGSHPPVTELVPVKPEEAPDDLPESEWPRVERFIRRNDAIPAEAVEITEADRAAIVSAPQFHRWNGTRLEALAIPAPTPAVPASVEDWQFAGQAADEGIITRTEALDWSGAGVIPPTLVAAVDRLITDEDQHFKVMIFLRGSKSYPRSHTLVSLLGRVFGKTDDAALDAFWIAAGQR